MRVALADDSTLFRNGLKALLREVHIDVVFEARTADELLAGLARADVDAVITDIRMPPTSTDEGVRAAIDIKQRTPAVGVLILSQYEDPMYAMNLFDMGLDGFGYLLKDRVDDVDVLTDRRVTTGQRPGERDRFHHRHPAVSPPAQGTTRRAHRT